MRRRSPGPWERQPPPRRARPRPLKWPRRNGRRRFPRGGSIARSAALMFFVGAGAVALLTSPKTPSIAAGTISGRASVIDGDTIEIRGERIRLHGVDAPE